MSRGRVYPPLAQRFWANVDKTPGFGPRGDCWRWTGALVHNGYGQISRAKVDGGRREYAHRIAYELHHEVLLGLARLTGPLVLHDCDVRSCVNPAHLFLGDDQANIADMKRKGRDRHADQRGEANNSRKLTDQQVLAIRTAKGTHQQVADQFGISMSWASSIRAGEAWQHLSSSTITNEGRTS